MTERSDRRGQEDPVEKDLWRRLQMAREARGMSLADVSAHLKLATRQIEALERGDLASLPGAAFARGFIRNYARFLQLDPAPFLKAVEAPMDSATMAVESQIYSPSLGRMPNPGKGRLSALPAALVVLLLLIILGLGWHFEWFEAREEKSLLETVLDSAPTPPQSAVSAPVAMNSSPAVSGPAVAAVSAPAGTQSVAPAVSVPVPSPAPAPGASLVVAASVPAVTPPQAAASAPSGAGLPRLVFSFEGESWVEVRDSSGKIVFSRLNLPGSVQEVQGVPPFQLVVGNAPRVRLAWKGRPVDLAPAIKGDVARLSVQ